MSNFLYDSSNLNEFAFNQELAPLAHFLMSHAGFAEFQKQTPDAWEIASLFPTELYLNNYSRADLLMASANELIKVCVGKCETTRQRINIAKGIQALSIADCHIGLELSFLYWVADRRWPLSEIKFILDQRALSLNLDRKFFKSANIPLSQAVTRILRLTDDFESRPHNYLEGPDAIEKALDSRKVLTLAASGKFDEAFNLGVGLGRGRSFWLVLSGLVLETKDPVVVNKCIRKLSDEELLTSKDIFDYLSNSLRQGIELVTEFDPLIACMASGRDTKILNIMMQYALEFGEDELAEHLLLVLREHSWARTPETVGIALQHLLQSGVVSNILEFIESPGVAAYLDLRTLDHIKYSRSSNYEDQLVLKIFELVRKISPSGEFGLTLLSWISEKTASDVLVSKAIKEVIENSNLSHVKAKYAVSSEIRVRSGAADLSRVFTLFRIARPSIFVSMQPKIKLFGEIFDAAVAAVALANSGQTETDWQLFDKWFGNSMFIGNLEPCVEYLSGQVQDENIAKFLSASYVLLSRHNFWLSESSLVGTLLYLAQGGSIEEREPLLAAVFDNPTRYLKYGTQATLLKLAESNSEIRHIGLVQKMAAKAGLSLSASVSAILTNSSIADGSFFQSDNIAAPNIESWSSLAIILDDVIHELNNPLGAISNWANVLKDPKKSMFHETAVQGLIASLSEIEGRMSQYRALTQEGTSAGLHDARNMTLEAIEGLANYASQKSVELRVEDGWLRGSRYVFGEAFLFKLAIRNLVKNAIDAINIKSRPGVVNISLHNPPRVNNQLVISVKDNGPGVPEHLKDTLFGKGIKSKRGRGLGLGLSLVASVTNAFGGSVRLASTGPNGTEIVMAIPSQIARDTSGRAWETINDEIF